MIKRMKMELTLLQAAVKSLLEDYEKFKINCEASNELIIDSLEFYIG